MKPTALLSLTTILVLTACEFEVPLATEHVIPIDPVVLGLWEPVPEEGKPQPDTEDRMLVLRFSDTEYLIHHPMGKDGSYWRGYAIRVGGIDCVQLERLGTRVGSLDARAHAQRFHVVRYRRTEGVLTITVLNSDLVDDDAQTTEALRNDFLRHMDDENLFGEAVRFRPVHAGSAD